MQRNQRTVAQLPSHLFKVLAMVVLVGHSIGLFANGLLPGVYQVSTRTLLPHLEEMRRSVSTQQACIQNDNPLGLFPILKQPGMAGCSLQRLNITAATSTYSLLCPGKNAATGTATLQYSNDTIDAQLNAKLGGKNMTFVQFAQATRLGSCPHETAP